MQARDQGAQVGAPKSTLTFFMIRSSNKRLRCEGIFKHHPVLCVTGGPVLSPSCSSALVSAPSPAHHSQKSHTGKSMNFLSTSGTGVSFGNPLYFLLYVAELFKTLRFLAEFLIRLRTLYVA